MHQRLHRVVHPVCMVPSLLMLLIFPLIHAAAGGKPTPDVHPLICSYGIWVPTPLSSVSFQDQVCLISAGRRNSYFSPRQILKNSKFTFRLNKGKRLKNYNIMYFISGQLHSCQLLLAIHPELQLLQ